MSELIVRRFQIDAAEVVVLHDEPSVARETADRTVAALRIALEARGTAHLALTGGSSAVTLHRELARPPYRDAIDWRDVHFWWGDDRFVPVDHPESNAGLAYRTLFAVAAQSGESGEGGSGGDVEAGDMPGLIVDPEKVHPIEAEQAIAKGLGVTSAAQKYAEQIGRLVPVGADGVPVFDVILLGIGPDGHTMSLFPGSAGLDDRAPLVMAAPAPDHVEPHLERVTLSAHVLPAAGAVFVMSAGWSKAEVIGNVLGTERNPARWPAQAAILPNSTWLLDEAAAAEVRAD